MYNVNQEFSMKQFKYFPRNLKKKFIYILNYNF